MSDLPLTLSTEAFLPAAEDANSKCVLRLYVTGGTPKSLRAVANIRALCEKHMPGEYELEVIDLFQQPLLAMEGQILAIPALVRNIPAPMRRIIGDLSDSDKVIAAMDIRTLPAQ